MSNTWTRYRLTTGEIIGWCSGERESPGPDYVISPQGKPGTVKTHYVVNGELCAYTAAEAAALANLPAGWTWLLPDRRAVDLRTAEQQAIDAAAAIDAARSAAYPPLADLADALYWQANKNQKPMDDYLAAVTVVKVKYPKPPKESK
jgi:hypothetical protein